MEESLRRVREQEDQPKEERIERMWEVWQHALHEFLEPRVQLPMGLKVQEWGRCVIASLPRPPMQKPMNPEGVCIKAIHKLHGETPLSGRQWAWFLDREGVITRYLGLEPADFRNAQTHPRSMRQIWTDRLQQAKIRERNDTMQEWKRSLDLNGNPTPKLYSWLRHKNPNPPMALRVEESERIGPGATLQGISEFWRDIKCRDSGEHEQLLDWIRQTPYTKTGGERQGSTSREDLLYSILRHGKKHTAPGMDGCPSEVLRLTPRRALKALCMCYDTCMEWAYWPQKMMMVRTHMLAKEGEDVLKLLTPADWRPIALTSVWMRAWAKWQLAMIPKEVLDRFDRALTGGLSGRTASGSMLEYLLSLEETAQSDLSGRQSVWMPLNASIEFTRRRLSC